MELSPFALAALFLVALVAGLIDAIAGGGGLLTLPALLTAGVPVTTAFGTNKSASSFGTGAALLRFWRAGLVDVRAARLLFPLGLLGSFAGAWTVTLVEPSKLKPLVLVLLLAAALVVTFVRPAETKTGAASHAVAKGAALAALVGAYDGFFGPGTGTFLIIGFMVLLHQPAREATANAKVVNFASNLAAMALFVSKGLVLWQVALPMAAGQLLGGVLGAQLAIKRGDALVRRLVLVVVFALVAKLAAELW